MKTEMPALSIMFKTVSSRCNLSCSYCYYRESRNGSAQQTKPDKAVLEKIIPAYMDYVSDVKEASFGWQGGEPTLAGLDFFSWVVSLQARSARRGTVISNDIQTNATLIDEEWAAFFKQFNFLAGVSLDGPEEIHDAMRKNASGDGSFQRVMSGIDAMRRRDVMLNILSVVTKHNVDKAEDLMSFFSSEGFDHLQFMPAMDFQATDPFARAGYCVTTEEYGNFLVRCFDIWWAGGVPTVAVRTFDNLLRSYLDLDSDLCVHGERCDSGLIVEHNGDVYPCDFYIHPDFRLGNVLTDTLGSIIKSDARLKFVARKSPLPEKCVACPWIDHCRGGCTRNRSSLPDGTESPDFFCRAYEMLFDHADERFKSLAERLKRRSIYLRRIDEMRAEGMSTPGRNDPCPCGSGKKLKTCCGAPKLDSSYLFA